MRGDAERAVSVLHYLVHFGSRQTAFLPEVDFAHTLFGGYSSEIPKPIMEALGDPDALMFIVKGKRVEVQALDEKDD